jgi:hypothetical protein
LELNFECNNQKNEKSFKYVFPEIIAAAVRAGTKLNIIDGGNENLNEFVANEIEKAGSHINLLFIDKSVNLYRMIAKAKNVELLNLTPSNSYEIK